MRPLVFAVLIGLAVSGCRKERTESINLINEGLQREFEGSTEIAYSNYLRAATIDPQNHRAFFHAALIEILDRDEPEKGLAHLAQAEKLAPDDRDIVYHLGRLHAVQTPLDADKALAFLDRTLVLDPNYAPAHYYRGVVLTAANRYKEADDAFREAIACDPAHGMSYRELASLYERFDHEDVAMAVYEAGVTHAQDKIDLYNNLGHLLMNSGKTAEALEAFEKALRFGGARPDTIFNVAFAHVQNGSPKLALQYLRDFINRAELAQGEQIQVATLVKEAMEREVEKQRVLEAEQKALDTP